MKNSNGFKLEHGNLLQEGCIYELSKTELKYVSGGMHGCGGNSGSGGSSSGGSSGGGSSSGGNNSGGSNGGGGNTGGIGDNGSRGSR